MSLLRRDRIVRGGGVAIYYNQQLLCREVTDGDLMLQDTLWCSVKMVSGADCIVGVIYRPPSAQESYNSSLLEKIRLVSSRYRTRVLIMGDFNLPNLLKSQIHPVNSLDSNFQELMHDLPLYNHVSNNTRFRGTDTPSILDLVLTGEENVVEDMIYETPLGLSDHLVLVFDYVCNAERSSDAHKTIRKVDFVKLSNALHNITDWSPESSDVHQHWSRLIGRLRNEIELHSYYVPKKPRKGFQFQVRSRTRKWIAVRNAAWGDHQRHVTPESWEKYRLLRNKVTKLVKEDKQEHQTQIIRKMEQNPKLLYQIVNNQSKVKPGVSPLQTSEGTTATASAAAEELANFYSTVFCPKECVTLSLHPLLSPTDTLQDMTVNAESVLLILLGLNTKKSPGADEITPLILKQCARSLYTSLTDLFNLSLNCSMVPMDWKCGTITPIFKGGDRSDVSNYRPVTLLPVISKVLERLVANKLTKHLEGNNILSIAQHGFRKSHSCLSNLLLTLDDWTLAIDNGNPIHACYLDMSKAFDRVNHSILLQKLKQHGVTGKLLAWLENYLMDRVIQVRVDGALSKPVAVTSGVPQGSVLGPTLFLIYANDIPNLVRCKIILFADDIKLWASIHTSEDCVLLQEDLNALYDWSLRNKLPFNFQKCKMLNIGKCVEFTYTLGPHRLAWTTDEKDLGVWISSSLKTSLQCTAVYKRTSKILALLKRIFGRFTRQTLPSILNTYIRPKMEYAVQVWSPWLQKDIVLLQRIYHRATKLVTGLQSKPYEDRIESLKLFDFCYRRIRGDLILTYNILHTLNHPLQKLFVRREPRISRTHDYLLAVPHSQGNSRRYFFAVRVCFARNSLPQNVAHSPNLNIFKTNLDSFLSTPPKIEPPQSA
ncbi:uncharacterized protein DEA37_0008638 [Paragonimus westermani]|uniref:Reverse transcriptase domain-containing protein n=1 Tax=Paragonimus westermani TaxID=34504 RepID=A0A5J4NZC1_9TREM|nr:uncharacterized protein DEA37_0008638 [Paragonimus westermani]